MYLLINRNKILILTNKLINVNIFDWNKMLRDFLKY